MSSLLHQFSGLGYVQSVFYSPAKEGKKAFASLSLETTVIHPQSSSVFKRYAQIDCFDALADKVATLDKGTYVFCTAVLETKSLKPTKKSNRYQALIGSTVRVITKTPHSPTIPTPHWSFLILGHLGRVNYFPQTAERKSFAALSVATDIPYLDKSNNWQSRTVWNYIKCFDALANSTSAYSLGTLVQITGYVNRVPLKREGKDSTDTPKDENMSYVNTLYADGISLIMQPKIKVDKTMADVVVDISVPPPLL